MIGMERVPVLFSDDFDHTTVQRGVRQLMYGSPRMARVALLVKCSSIHSAVQACNTGVLVWLCRFCHGMRHFKIAGQITRHVNKCLSLEVLSGSCYRWFLPARPRGYVQASPSRHFLVKK